MNGSIPRSMVLLVSLVALGSAPGASGAQIAVLGNTTVEIDAVPGLRRIETMRVVNVSADVQDVRLYKTDYQFSADGATRFEAPGSHDRSNADWVQLSHEFVTIRPGDTATVSYETTVPRSDSLDGTYWSVVMVEAVPPALSRRGPARQQISVTPTIRYAIQVVTHIGTEAVAVPSVVDARLVAASDTAAHAFVVDVASTGRLAFRGKLSLEIYDADGALRSRTTASRGLVYPGSSFRHRFGLTDLPPGSYRAVFLVDAGNDVIVGSEYRLTLE